MQSSVPSSVLWFTTNGEAFLTSPSPMYGQLVIFDHAEPTVAWAVSECSASGRHLEARSNHCMTGV